MRKKTIFETLVIVGVLVVACIPIVSAAAPPYDSWVVTDEVIPMWKDEHDFYDEVATEVTDEHTQEWYYDNRGTPTPIKEGNYYIDTEIDMWADSSGNNTILYIDTYGTNTGTTTVLEEVRWTIINGNTYNNPVFYVDLGFSLQPITVEVDGDTENVDLGEIQNLSMDLEFNAEESRSPGQKYYWIETDYPTYQGKDYQNVTLPGYDYQSQSSITSLNHNLTWWTDYYGVNTTISTYNFHINTKALVWVEESGNNLKVCVKVYGESNYYPELIMWTIADGKNAPAPYFNVQIDTEDADMNVNIALGDDPQFQELGSIELPMDLDLVFYEQ